MGQTERARRKHLRSRRGKHPIPLPREVFLSHSAKDRGFADRLARILRQHGVPVWYSATNIFAASQWHDEIGKALARCDWFAVVLSPHSVKSRWVKRELLYALNDLRYDNRIVPLLRRPCSYTDLSWTFGAIELVDFTTDFDEGCRCLLRVWGLGYEAGSRRIGGRLTGPSPDSSLGS
jgi:TIR domain-containing protein